MTPAEAKAMSAIVRGDPVPTAEQELRELDAWIAEHVMGYKQDDRNHKRWWIDGETTVTFRPTTESRDAFAVLEKCAEQCTVTVESSGKHWTVCRLNLEGSGDYVEDFCKCDVTLPFAIARFARKLFAEKGATP